MSCNPKKDVINRAKHGLSLAAAFDLDLATALVVPDERSGYGEPRYRAFGELEGVWYCLAFTIRAGRLRPISFRRAREKEVRRHEKALRSFGGRQS